MEEFILKENISIQKPVIFLCGPFFDSSHIEDDRRFILRRELLEIYNNKVIPLIIDNYLTNHNINRSVDEVDVQLLEEIFAGISDRTYIFLDSLSAATELGLFLAHTVSNKAVVLIPEKSSVFDEEKIGNFIRNIVLKGEDGKIRSIEYRPSVKLKALSTDYINEYYGFIDNKVSDTIVSEISNHKPEVIKDIPIRLIHSAAPPELFFDINYLLKDDVLFLWTHIRLLFYATVSVIYEEYSAYLTKDSEFSLDDYNINQISEIVTHAYCKFASIHLGIKPKKIELKTDIKEDVQDLIRHITAFVYVYHVFSNNNQLKFLLNTEHIILKRGLHPFDLFGINDDDAKVLLNSVEESEKYFARQYIKKKGKRREIVTYLSTDDGKHLRGIHEKILKSLQTEHNPHGCSFAYRKGYSIKKCISSHLGNTGFIKLDVHEFFHSIQPLLLAEKILNEFKIDSAYRSLLVSLVKSLFIDGRLPLGLILSPILSDIYLCLTDKKVNAFCENCGYKYTRYADDILISADHVYTEDEIKLVEDILSYELEYVKLELNDRKTKISSLLLPGDHIKYLGINIVKGTLDQFVSVGKQYIYQVAKDYIKYNQKVEAWNHEQACNESPIALAYEAKRIAGKIDFIREIEGERGWWILLTRLGKYAVRSDTDNLVFAEIQRNHD